MKVLRKILGAVVGFVTAYVVMKIIEIVGMVIAKAFIVSEEAFSNVEATILIGSLLIGVYAGARIYQLIAKSRGREGREVSPSKLR
jgi:hypothetical protein